MQYQNHYRFFSEKNSHLHSQSKKALKNTKPYTKSLTIEHHSIDKFKVTPSALEGIIYSDLLVATIILLILCKKKIDKISNNYENMIKRHIETIGSVNFFYSYFEPRGIYGEEKTDKSKKKKKQPWRKGISTKRLTSSQTLFTHKPRDKEIRTQCNVM